MDVVKLIKLEVPGDAQVGPKLLQGEEFVHGSSSAFGEQAFPKLLFFTIFSVISPHRCSFLSLHLQKGDS